MTELARNQPIRSLDLRRPSGASRLDLKQKEWLATNGLGGYASGSLCGTPTRRYHAPLVAALPAPFGRWVMLNHLLETVTLANGRTVRFGDLERVGRELNLANVDALAEFRLEQGLPVWRFEADGYVWERRVFLTHEQNTVHISYRLLTARAPVRLEMRPGVNFHQQEGMVRGLPAHPFQLVVSRGRYELQAEPEGPKLRMQFLTAQPAFTVNERVESDVYYEVEARRGYDSQGELWSPGSFHADVAEGEQATLVASAESWELIEAMRPGDALAAERERRAALLDAAPPEAREGVAAELVLAADQFLVLPSGRAEETARARAAGEQVRTVIAGYHWFTDWGRDTMISLEGLTLATGRSAEARAILRTFAHYVRDGLIPNMFPEGEKEGLYHTADATLWFFHAMERYRRTTGDPNTLRALLPTFQEIVRRHLEGTRFGIGVDPADGLLRQGEEGYQLTWMDAKCDGWVVTPRRGKAVEINALWYNALRLLADWLEESDPRAAQDLNEKAAQTRRSFNRRFWYEAGGYLYDVVDGDGGDDRACRPNQLLAISLDHPALDESRWPAVVEVVQQRLLTPAGLRSLAPDHPDYKAVYEGDLPTRDAAYHQGTVWGWLIGPFVDAWLKTHAAGEAPAFLGGILQHLDDGGIGSISEIFDGDPPHPPRGCIAQAWSVAEALRVWLLLPPESRAASERDSAAVSS